jgi:hypothetical protein
MRYGVLLACAVCSMGAAAVLFSDDFEDGNADGWTEISNGALYHVASGIYHFSYDSESSSEASLLIEWDNVEVTDDITLELTAGTLAATESSF